MADALAAIVAGIAGPGYAIVPDALPRSLMAELRDRARALAAAGAFASAHIGRGDARSERTAIRGDRIAWLADAPGSPAEASLLAWLESLRDVCNRELLLGLVAFEGHYAIYPTGAAYARHRDRFRDDDTRVLSCVLYLNDAWRAEDAGALRLHLPAGAALDVAPEGGTFVVFLSDTFDHEVLPASRERMALTGWLKRRALGAAAGTAC